MTPYCFFFSDYNLISDFAQKCRNDIDNKACGHVRRQMHSDSNKIFYHHSQGKHNTFVANLIM